jgi:hypothetical protein
MIEVVCLDYSYDEPDVEVETYTYHNRLRSVHDCREFTLFAIKSAWTSGQTIRWMDYSR